MTDETGVSIKATSVEPETETALLLGSHPREEPKTLGCSDTPNIPELPTGPLDRPTSTGVALAQDLYKRVVGEDDHGAATVASPPCAITPPLSPRREEERREEKRREMPHLKNTNGRSPRLLAGDGRERAMNTRCAGGIHGCPGSNWGTLSGCCRSMRLQALQSGTCGQSL